MLIKAVLVFLLVMVAIAMAGNALFPGALGRSVQRRLPIARTARCPTCSKPLIGSSDCDCGGK